MVEEEEKACQTCKSRFEKSCILNLVKRTIAKLEMSSKDTAMPIETKSFGLLGGGPSNSSELIEQLEHIFLDFISN